MAIVASEKSTNYEPISEGVHTAVCIWIVDIGEQWNELYQKSQRKVIITWEVQDETIVIDGEEKPRAISREYTMSLSEKAILRQHLESWRGKKFTYEELQGFDLINVLGKSCQIQILHNEKGYANVSSIMSLPKGMPALEPINDTIYFDLTDPASLDLLDSIPAWMQDKVRQSKTYEALSDGTKEYTEVEDDGSLPF